MYACVCACRPVCFSHCQVTSWEQTPRVIHLSIYTRMSSTYQATNKCLLSDSWCLALLFFVELDKNSSSYSQLCRGLWCELLRTILSTVNCLSLLLVSSWLGKIRIYNVMTASRRKRAKQIKPVFLLLCVFTTKWNLKTAGYFFELCSKQ